jgi:hypothetical protein
MGKTTSVRCTYFEESWSGLADRHGDELSIDRQVFNIANRDLSISQRFSPLHDLILNFFSPIYVFSAFLLLPPLLLILLSLLPLFPCISATILRYLSSHVLTHS